MSTDQYPNTVFHYCSIESFYNIISSKSLRLTDVKYFRDSTEGIRLKEFYNKAMKTYDSNNKALIDQVLTEVNFVSERVFAVCFSKKSDDINQWRSYADDGEGVALGMNVRFFGEIKRILEINWTANEYENLHFEEVRYNQKEYEDILHYIFSLVEDIAIEFSPEEAIRVGSFLTRRLSIVCKHYSFSSEKEVRLYIVPLSPFSNTSRLTSTRFKRRYYIRRKDLVPSYDYIIEEDFTDSPDYIRCFNNIILGPRCKIKKNEIVDFMNDNRFDIEASEIINSKIPYI